MGKRIRRSFISKSYLFSYLPGLAANYAIKACNYTKAKIGIFVVRVSNRERKKNLAAQIARTKAEYEKQGWVILKTFRHIGSGRDSSWLIKYVHYARRHNAAIIAESLDRLKRSPFYHSVTFPEARAREIDLRELKQDTMGIDLVTLIDPDAELKEVRSAQIKRGKDKPKAKGTHLKKAFTEYAIKLHEQGMGCRKIAECMMSTLGIYRHWTTIGKWIQKSKGRND
jgi:predicted site-specific integrase-resolvase